MPYTTIDSLEDTLELNKSVEMISLNPNQPSDKVLRRDLFPHHSKYFNELIANGYKTFLETNATTDDGMMFIAEHYSVKHNWRSYVQEWNHLDWAEKFYNLLLIVKTMSKEDHVWISFIEGLHQHAANVM
jgi:hypothetical protein